MPNVSRFHPLFPSDLAGATAYYDKISLDLGDRFRENVRGMLTRIRDNPEAFGYVGQGLRAAMVRQFPYVVIYRVIGDTTVIGGLFHAASDPIRWSTRLDDASTA